MYGVELYAAVRLAVVDEGLSHHEAAQRFGTDRRAVKKMPDHPVKVAGQTASVWWRSAFQCQGRSSCKRFCGRVGDMIENYTGAIRLKLKRALA